MTKHLHSNKERAIDFFRLASAGQIDEAFANYIAPDFRHHNAYFAGTAAALAQGMHDGHEMFPHKLFEVQRALEDGDLVAIHAHVRLKPNGSDIVLIHIVRFADHKIIEMWEAGQEVPATTPNKNGIF